MKATDDDSKVIARTTAMVRDAAVQGLQSDTGSTFSTLLGKIRHGLTILPLAQTSAT